MCLNNPTTPRDANVTHSPSRFKISVIIDWEEEGGEVPKNTKRIWSIPTILIGRKSLT